MRAIGRRVFQELVEGEVRVRDGTIAEGARQIPTNDSEFKVITNSERGVTGAWGRRKPAVLVRFQPF